MKTHFRKHFGIALGYAGWVRAARIAWMLSRTADTSLHGKANCSGGIPCTTCPDTGPCGKTGCVRQAEHWSRPAAPMPAPEPFAFGGDLGKTAQLVIKLEQVNAVQWSATSNHSARIVRQADAHDALRLALEDAGTKSGEVPPVDCYIGWARFTERSIVFCDSDAPGAFRVYRARNSTAASGVKGLDDAQR